MIMVGCPIHNRCEHVDTYIESILDLCYPKKDLSLVILDHASTDGTYEKLLEYKDEISYRFGRFEVYQETDIPVVNEYNRDYELYARIRNEWLGYRKDEDYVFSIDSDIWVPQDSLNRLLANNKDICSILVYNAAPNLEIYNFMYRNGRNIIRGGLEGETLKKVDITGAAYLIKKDVLDAGVKYGYHSNGEDVFFCDEAQEHGFDIYCDTSLVAIHNMGARHVQ